MPERPVAMFAMSAENVPQVFPAEVMTRLREVVDIDPALVAEELLGASCARGARRDRDPDHRLGLPAAGCGHARRGAEAACRAALRGLGEGLHHTGGLGPRPCGVLGAVANALPVAEYTLAVILLAGKDLFAQRDRLRARRSVPGWALVPGIGNYGRRVGVVGASRSAAA